MSRKLTPLQKYVRESDQWPARRARRFFQDRNLDKWVQWTEFVAGLGIWVLVLLLIGFAESVHVPQQLGLP